MSGDDALSRVYGRHAAHALLQRRAKSVRAAWVLDSLADSDEPVFNALRQADVPVQRVAADKLNALCEGGVHQGICLDVVPLAAEGEPALWRLLDNIETAPLVLVLDGVQDPRNLGACLRTAEAAGCLAVVIPRDKSAPLSATARKAAVGAAERVPLVRVGNLARTLDTLAEYGLWRVGAAGEAEQVHTAVDFCVPTALVMGAEGRGLRRLTRDRCDLLTRIPLVGEAGSLNVSVAAGVLLFEAARQRALSLAS